MYLSLFWLDLPISGRIYPLLPWICSFLAVFALFLARFARQAAMLWKGMPGKSPVCWCHSLGHVSPSQVLLTGGKGGTLGKGGTPSFPAPLSQTSHPPHQCPPSTSMHTPHLHTEPARGSSHVGAHPGVCVSPQAPEQGAGHPLAAPHEAPGNSNACQREEAPEKQFHPWIVTLQA